MTLTLKEIKELCRPTLQQLLDVGFNHLNFKLCMVRTETRSEIEHVKNSDVLQLYHPDGYYELLYVSVNNEKKIDRMTDYRNNLSPYLIVKEIVKKEKAYIKFTGLLYDLFIKNQILPLYLNPIQAEALTAIKINRKFEFVPVLLFNKEKYLYLKSQLISLINNSDDKNINKQLNDLCCNELVYGNMARERLNCIKEVLFDLEEM